MAAIATCPQCAKQLGLPPTASADDSVECPECLASFSLSETVQISLPPARLLPAEAPQAATTTPAIQPELSAPSNAASTEDAAENAEDSCRKAETSWEERLKKALALDSSTDAEIADEQAPGDEQSTPTNHQPTAPARETKTSEYQPVAPARETTKIPSPSFEFQLDPTPAAAQEAAEKPFSLELPTMPEEVQATPDATPVKQVGEARVKTLADFAASAVDASVSGVPEVELMKQDEPAPTKPSKSKRLAKSLASAAAPTVKTAAKAAKQAKPAVEKAAKASASTIPGRKVARRGFPKVAAFAVGPIAGTLLGLYGLLWLQGDKADYVGLSHMLPASILPAISPTEPEQSGEQAELVATESPLEKLLAKRTKAPSHSIKQDKAVSLASATQPIAKPSISASEFSTLVDAASDALPDLLAGDLTSQASIQRKGQAYMALCRLSEHFDFAQQPGLAPGIEAKVREAKQLYRMATNTAAVRRDLAHIAGRWWEYEQRPSPGIFLAGQVTDVEQADGGTLCWVQLGNSASSPKIPVWSTGNQLQVDDQVGVVGRVTPAPSGRPQGFVGGHVVKMSHGFAL